MILTQPYVDMTQSEQDLDRVAANTILSSLLKWGYSVAKVSERISSPCILRLAFYRTRLRSPSSFAPSLH